MTFTVIANTSMQTVKDEIADKAKTFGFGILHEYNFKEILKEKGHPIDDEITVFEICNPVAAREALTLYPEISVFLPCRISLFQRDGKVILSTIDIDVMLNSFAIADEFKTQMRSVFEILVSIMKSWE